MYQGTVSLFGDPRIDKLVSTTAAWQTLAEILGEPIINNKQDPVAVFFSIKDTTNDALFGWGGTAEHPLTSSSTNPASALITGAAAVKSLKLKSAAAGSAASVSITVFY